jgi:hypothetical protein
MPSYLHKTIVAVVAAFAVLLALPSYNATAFEYFISRDGSTLLDGKKPYRFVSVNIPNYFILEDRAGKYGKKWHRVTEFEQRRKGQNGSWQTIAMDISDALPVNHNGEIIARLPLFSDQPGPGLWAYWVIARNDGGASSPSNSVQVTVSK